MSEQEKAPEEQAAPDLASILAEFPGAPDKVQLEAMKKQHGEVFCSGFSDTELFIWKPVTRKEYLVLQKNQTQESDFQEQLVNLCVLWGSDMGSLEKKAGSVMTLAEQIMQNSNFMAPQLAASLVIKL